MKDEIMAEVWRTRDELGERYEHDLDKIVAAIRERERRPLTAMCEKRPPDSAPRAERHSQ
jgi:hypothetical protein